MWLGLGAALAWGFADYLAQPATRNLGSVRAAFYAQFIGLLLLLPYTLLTQSTLLHADAQAWLWIAVTALLGAVGGLAFYQSANLGNLAVVAPIMGSYGAVTTALAWLWGERPTPLVGLGLLLALVSVVLVSLPPRAARLRVTARQRQGVYWAIASALVLGTCFFVMGRELTPRLGGGLGTWWMRVVTVSLTFVTLVALRQSLAFPGWRNLVTPGLSGLLATSAFLLTALGLGRGEDAIVTVLGSMSIVITTILALFIGKDRLSPVQWGGVVLALVSVVLIGMK